MNKFTIALSASLLLCLAGGVVARQDGVPASVPAPGSNATGPQMVFETERVSFGKVLDTEQQTVKFKFRNVGGSDLRLGQVKTNIDTIIYIDSTKRSFAPGESGELVFQVDPSRWRGRVGSVVTVMSNSPGLPFELTIEGIVEKTVDVKPPVARFGWMKPDQKPAVTLTVTGRTPDFRVVSAKTQAVSNNLKVIVGEPVDFELNGEKLRRVTIDITSDNPLPLGEVTDILEIATTDPRKSLLTLPVVGWVGETPPPANAMPPSFTHQGKQIDAKPLTNKDLPMRDGGVQTPKPVPAQTPQPAKSEPAAKPQ